MIAFRVCGVLLLCASLLLRAAQATTGADAPVPPTNLFARAQESGRIGLSGTDRADNGEGFLIRRSTDGNSFPAPTATGPRSRVGNTLSYEDSGLRQETRYWYRVCAWNASRSNFPNVASAIAESAPAAPSNLTVLPRNGGRLQLTWTDNSDDERGFVVERSPDGLTFTPRTTTRPFEGAGQSAGYMDTGLPVGTRWYYRVRAFKVFNSPYSNVASEVAWGPAAPPTWPHRDSVGTVIWGPYDTADAGIANYIANAGQTSVETMMFGHRYCLRQGGLVKRLRFHVADLTGITGLQVKIWSPTSPISTSYTLRTATANLLPYLTVGMNDLTFSQMNPPQPDLPAREGDRYGIRIEWSGGARAYNLFAHTGVPSAFTCYVVNQSGKSGTYPWASQAKLPGVAFPVEFYGNPPQFAGLGDSLISGNGGQTGDPAHGSYLETGSAENLPNSWMWQLGYLFGGSELCTNQNLGRSGQRSDEIALRINELVRLHPAWAVIQMGTNDLAQNAPFAVYDASWTTVLDACLADGILPVACFIPPWKSFTNDTLGGTNARMTTRDIWRQALRAKCASYGVDEQGRPRVVVVDLDPYLGAYRPGGPPGNRWDPVSVPAVTADGLHCLRVGKALEARAVGDALRRDGYATFGAGLPVP